MLTASFIGLRFIHFSTLMLVFGCTLFINRLTPFHLQPLLSRQFQLFQRVCLGLSFFSALLMYALQGGMMGDGWHDVWQPETWLALADTHFGGIWIWQILIAMLALSVALIQPRYQGRLLLLCGAQLLLMAGVGHAAINDGALGFIQRTNHALHLIGAAAWFGGLLPVIYCMKLVRRSLQNYAVMAMMRFSRYGHLFVAGVLATGVINALLIQGGRVPWDTAWGRALLLKSALVALMVAIALVNRYVLVPRLSLKDSQARYSLILMTWTEVALGALALAAVSLFATWEPF
ncbi:copper homeostasis membrane protein CopD [Phytobacter sp. V91]|uniref:copper homeostasis membrane protein CopD n=1 Tax=Phytobacter sp. V91 TaxID=3369425 RepID=UPI003F62F85E